MNRCLSLVVLWVFGSESLLSQDITGQWLFKDIKVSYPTSISAEERAKNEAERLKLLHEGGGKTLNEFTKDGYNVKYSIENGDTAEFSVKKYRIENTRIFIETDSVFTKCSYKIKGKELRYIDSAINNNIVLTVIYSFVGGKGKTRYKSNETSYYYRNGFPARENKWTFEDYANAVTLLIQLEKERKMPLPDFRTQSGTLLQKLCTLNPEELENVPGKAKNPELYFAFSAKALLNLHSHYDKVDEKMGGKFYSAEKLSIYTAIINFAELELTEILRQNAAQKDELTRLTTKRRIERSLKEVIEGNLIVLGVAKELYNKADACTLAKLILGFYRKYKNLLYPGDLETLDKMILEMNNQHKLPCYEASLLGE